MVSSELISTLRGLSRSDKFHIMQILISELAQQETDLIKPDQSYRVWSPYDAFEAADTMLKVLHAAKDQDHA
jgi:ribonuclease D